MLEQLLSPQLKRYTGDWTLCDESLGSGLGHRKPATPQITHPDQKGNEAVDAAASRWPVNPFSTPVRKAILSLRDLPVKDLPWKLKNTGSYPSFNYVLERLAPLGDRVIVGLVAHEAPGCALVLTNASIGNTALGVPTVTLKLPTATAARLERMAARLRTTKSVVMREALEEKLRSTGNEPSVYDLMKASVGSIDSGVRDLGHNRAHLKEFGLK
ncbi:MAG TPA: ribbon-helix-helix domain-containing protein [Opitutaceae bacterium]